MSDNETMIKYHKTQMEIDRRKKLKMFQHMWLSLSLPLFAHLKLCLITHHISHHTAVVCSRICVRSPPHCALCVPAKKRLSFLAEGFYCLRRNSCRLESIRGFLGHTAIHTHTDPPEEGLVQLHWLVPNIVTMQRGVFTGFTKFIRQCRLVTAQVGERTFNVKAC